MNLKSLALAASLIFVGSACIIQSNSNTHRTGRYISAETLQSVQVGAPSADVRALLGEPDSRTPITDGEIWKWSYRVEKKSQGALLLVFADDRTDVTEGATYVEFENDVVVKRWQD